ncbi:MAG: exosortase [Candidatus Rokubacteria bacterium]|nr:exosortase [Candidatus Rokubacteria bacterium]
MPTLTKNLPALEQEQRERAHGRLRAGVLAGAVVAILIGLYARVLPVWLADLWDDPTYSHVYIVPIISGFVMWQRRRHLATLPIRGSWRGVPLILAGVAALIVGDIGAETFLMRSSLIVILAGLVLFHFGWAMLRALAFPLGFFLFLVPMPAIFFYAMTARLQNLAAENGAWALDLLGVPVLLDGNVIHLSNLTLGVTEACSGIRSLITLVALGVAWAHLMLPRFWMQVVLVISVLPITIVTNAGRIVMTGLVGRSFGVEYAEGFFHFFSGWLVFIVAILCLLAVHGVLRAVSPRRVWDTA